MSEITDDTITLEQTVRIAASPETVWSFSTGPRRLAEWWGTAAEVEAEPGGLFRVTMESGPVMPARSPNSSRRTDSSSPSAGNTTHPANHSHPARRRRSDTDTRRQCDRAHTPAFPNAVNPRDRSRKGLELLRRRPTPRGSRRRVSVDIQTEIVIDRPVEVVTGVRRRSHERSDLVRQHRVGRVETSPPGQRRSRVAFVPRFLGRRLSYTYEFVDYSPPDRLVMRTTQGPFPMQTTYTWTPTDGAKNTHDIAQHRNPERLLETCRAVHGCRDTTSEPQRSRQTPVDPRSALAPAVSMLARSGALEPQPSHWRARWLYCRMTAECSDNAPEGYPKVRTTPRLAARVADTTPASETPGRYKDLTKSSASSPELIGYTNRRVCVSVIVNPACWRYVSA